MSRFKVDGYEIDVDVAELLSQYEWDNPRWRSGKLQAASPFRDDRHPSFFVSLDNGAWGDSGAYDEYYSSGNLAKLLAFLRNETYEESLEYLIEFYGVKELREGDRISLPSMSLKSKAERIVLPEDFLHPYKFRNPYLGSRGISENIQKFMGIGYDKSSKAVTMPWRHADGTLANVKYRQIYGKTFWYASNAAPIGDLVYGIDKIYARNIKKAVVCEAEIDAMSWMTYGIPAIAIGRTAVRDTQLDLIIRSPLEEIIKAIDNDGPGAKMGRMLDAGLRGHMSIASVDIPLEYKDSNEALTSGVNLRQLIV